MATDKGPAKDDAAPEADENQSVPEENAPDEDPYATAKEHENAKSVSDDAEHEVFPLAEATDAQDVPIVGVSPEFYRPRPEDAPESGKEANKAKDDK